MDLIYVTRTTFDFDSKSISIPNFIAIASLTLVLKISKNQRF